MGRLKIGWAWSFALIVACSCTASPRKDVREHGRARATARAQPSLRKGKATTRPKDRLPGAYYVAGVRPYLLVVMQFDQDFPRKIVRIPQGQVSMETTNVARPEEYPEVTSHPISFHLLTIDSPRHLPVLLRMNMGATFALDLDTYATVNGSLQHFHYGQSKEQHYGTIWLNGGRNTFEWTRDEGS